MPMTHCRNALDILLAMPLTYCLPYTAQQTDKSKYAMKVMHSLMRRYCMHYSVMYKIMYTNKHSDVQQMTETACISLV